MTADTTLQAEVFKGTSVRLIPLLFTDVPQFGTKEMTGVRLINANDIDSIWRDVLDGQEVDQIVFKYFLSPSSIIKSTEII
jgi:hypothetical protein